MLLCRLRQMQPRCDLVFLHLDQQLKQTQFLRKFYNQECARALKLLTASPTLEAMAVLLSWSPPSVDMDPISICMQICSKLIAIESALGPVLKLAMFTAEHFRWYLVVCLFHRAPNQPKH